MRTRNKAKPEQSQPKPDTKTVPKTNPLSKTVPKKNLKKDKQQQKVEKVIQVEENKKDLIKQENDKKEDKKEQIQPKKTVQPKKYLKKNYDQLSRIARSQHQKIYLLQANRQQEGEWNFLVQGFSGSNYKVNIHHTALKCTCVDFRMKQKPCKHIYFIVTQVAQNAEILDYFSNSLKISKTAFKILDDQLTNRLHSRMNQQKDTKKQDIDLKDDTDCTICFTEMDKTNQNLEGCGTCKKYFHFQCLAAWKKHNPTCPLCRSNLAGSGNDKDPLGKLLTIQINSQKAE